MNHQTIPPKGSLTRNAKLDIQDSPRNVFNYVSSSDTLPDWLRKTGPVNGAVKVTNNEGPYTFVGANRTVIFDDGSSILEQLIDYQPHTYYAYSVTRITNKLRGLISIGYGQWWFVETKSSTQVTWAYSFVPKNFLARILLSLFLSLFYVRFMKHSLHLVQQQLEEKDIVGI